MFQEYQLAQFGPYNNPENIQSFLSSLWSIIDYESRIKFTQYILQLDDVNLVSYLLSTKIKEYDIEDIVIDFGSLKILSLFEVFKSYTNGESGISNYETHSRLAIRFNNPKLLEKMGCKDFYIHGMNLIYGNYHLVPSDFQIKFLACHGWFCKFLKYDLIDVFIYMIEHNHGSSNIPSDYLYSAICSRSTKIINYICKDEIVVDESTLNVILKCKCRVALDSIVKVKWPQFDRPLSAFELIKYIEKSKRVRSKVLKLMEGSNSEYVKGVLCELENQE